MGWIISVLILIGYCGATNAPVGFLIAAGLFAIAGAIGGHK